jgi:uncharacterized protein
LVNAKGYIGDALDRLGGPAPDSLDAGADLAIAYALPNGMIFDMSGTQYVRDWALPQFYFHVMTTYAVLRHHGVELGKVDYVTHMSAYLRPGTIPAP